MNCITGRMPELKERETLQQAGLRLWEDLESNASSEKPKEQIVCYCDGGCLGNGSQDAWMYGSFKIGDLIIQRIEFGKRGTNNEAEYRILIELLLELHRRKIVGAWICMDSRLVVEQVAGRWKVYAENLQPLRKRALKGMKILQAQLSHVPREKIVEVLGH